MTQNTRQLPSRISTGGIADYVYSYDANANVKSITSLGNGGQNFWVMNYDGLDRLLSSDSTVFAGEGVHRFTYDALDNLTSWKLGGVKDYAAYVYDPTTYRLKAIQDSSGAEVQTFAFDAQGNLAAKNAQAYSFDYGNRLRSVAGKENYGYDALGRRMLTAAANGSATTAWQYDRGGTLRFWSDWNAPGYSNQKTHENIYLGGQLVATVDRQWPGNAVIATTYQHTDALGSAVAKTNEAGLLVQNNDYDPFGAVIGKPTYSGLGYTGHVMDGATGLTYMQQRYYDPTIGTFLSVDPVAADASTGRLFNRYAYALNNPYTLTDPDGRDPFGDDPDKTRQHVPIVRLSSTSSLLANKRIRVRGTAGVVLGYKIKTPAGSKNVHAGSISISASERPGEPRRSRTYEYRIEGPDIPLETPWGDLHYKGGTSVTTWDGPTGLIRGARTYITRPQLSGSLVDRIRGQLPWSVPTRPAPAGATAPPTLNVSKGSAEFSGGVGVFSGVSLELESVSPPPQERVDVLPLPDYARDEP